MTRMPTMPRPTAEILDDILHDRGWSASEITAAINREMQDEKKYTKSELVQIAKDYFRHDAKGTPSPARRNKEYQYVGFLILAIEHHEKQQQ